MPLCLRKTLCRISVQVPKIFTSPGKSGVPSSEGDKGVPLGRTLGGRLIGRRERGNTKLSEENVVVAFWRERAPDVCLSPPPLPGALLTVGDTRPMNDAWPKGKEVTSAAAAGRPILSPNGGSRRRSPLERKEERWHASPHAAFLGCALLPVVHLPARVSPPSYLLLPNATLPPPSPLSYLRGDLGRGDDPTLLLHLGGGRRGLMGTAFFFFFSVVAP